MRCRFFGPLPLGMLPIFNISDREPEPVWVLDDTLVWEQRANRRVILQFNEVTKSPTDWEAILRNDLGRMRRIHERYLLKHTKPFRDDEGIFTIAYRGADGLLGLAWSVFPLIPSRDYFRLDVPPLKKELPPWWNAMV